VNEFGERAIMNISYITDYRACVQHVVPVLQRFLDLYECRMKSHLHVANSTSLSKRVVSTKACYDALWLGYD